jgi:hypothetical protein
MVINAEPTTRASSTNVSLPKQCCCCIDLRDGSMVRGWLYIISAALYAAVAALLRADELTAALYPMIISAVIAAAAGALLLIGVHRNST